MGNTATKESRPQPATVRSVARHGAHRDREAAKRHRKERRKEEPQLIMDPSETVDGGYLFPQGVYTAAQDFKVTVVRDFITRRKMAPFYKGLEYVDPNWTDEELLFAINARPGTDLTKVSASVKLANDSDSSSKSSDAVNTTSEHLENLSLERTSNGSTSPPAQRCTPETSHTAVSSPKSSGSHARKGSEIPSSKDNAAVPGRRRRANTTSVLQTATSRDSEERDAQAVWLYRNVHECPICFLLYPRLNNTRCCGQEICTECFVQIKRAPPHPPYRESGVTSPTSTGTGATDESGATGGPGSEQSSDLQLISEPVSCPYCAMPNLGITFEAPPFEWGIPKPDDSRTVAQLHKESCRDGSKRDSSKRDSNKLREPSPVENLDPNVVTTDHIRPDWESTLASARRRLARRSEAARQLHLNSLLIPGADGETTRRRGGTGSGRRRGNGAYLDAWIPVSFGMSQAQTRELENRMLAEAIRQSLNEV